MITIKNSGMDEYEHNYGVVQNSISTFTKEEIEGAIKFIPADILVLITFDNDLPERNQCLLVSKKWNIILDHPSQWRELGKKLLNLTLKHLSLDNKEQIKKFIESNKKEILRENNFVRYWKNDIKYNKFSKLDSNDHLMRELQDLSSTLKIKNINKLQSICEARNIIFMGKELLGQPHLQPHLIGLTPNMDIGDCLTVEEILNKKDEILEWCTTNQLALSQASFCSFTQFILTSLPADILNFLPNLKEFSIKFSNDFDSMPKEIGLLTNLIHLNVEGKAISFVPKEIGLLTNLASLGLTGQSLTSLPAEISRLTNLKTLNLEYNQITLLPAEISRLSNLKTLDLANNKITLLPAEFYQLTNLEALNLKNNQITLLPSEILQLTKLQDLNLESNPLISYPVGFLQSNFVKVTIEVQIEQGTIEKITNLFGNLLFQ